MRDVTEKPAKVRTAAALGLFDGLHIGHRAVIERAVKSGFAPAVFTFSDGATLPKLREGRKLLLSEKEKRRLLCEWGAEYILSPDFSSVRDMSPESFVREIIAGRLNAACVVCGYDFRFGKNGAGGAELLKAVCAENGITCEVVPAVKQDGRAISSAEIRTLIESGNIEEANRLLGREHSYTLPVIKGRRLGRTIGFPTANQHIPDELICPAHGVYASRALIDGREYPAMTDIGVKPTVKDDDSVITETHVIGYEGSLYGKELTVSLRRFIRPEKKFGSLDELRKQLEIDRKQCEN